MNMGSIDGKVSDLRFLLFSSFHKIFGESRTNSFLSFIHAREQEFRKLHHSSIYGWGYISDYFVGLTTVLNNDGGKQIIAQHVTILHPKKGILVLYAYSAEEGYGALSSNRVVVEKAMPSEFRDTIEKIFQET